MRSDRSDSEQDQDHGEKADQERPAKRARTSITNINPSAIREVGLMRKNVEDNYASFLGSASGIHFIRSVYSAVGDRHAHPPQHNQTPESNLVPGEDDRLQSEIGSSFDTYLWQAHEVSSVPGTLCHSFDQMLSWTKTYFDHWHPAYPFLHAPSVLEMFERLSKGIEIAPDTSQRTFAMAIIRSVMSISLADQRQLGHVADPVPADLVFDSFKHAMDSIDLVLSTRTSVMSLQALVSVQLFLVSMLRHNAASRLGGLITRMVFHLGLHRCPSRYSAFSEQEVQLRQRIFWSVYCIDRHICQSLGLPLTLRDDDIDVCYIGHEKHSKDPKMKQTIDNRLQLLDLLAKHAEIKGLILESMHKSLPHRQLHSEKSSHIVSKLARWSNDVESYRDGEGENEIPLSRFHAMMLVILKQECVIALNRPLLAVSKRDGEYHAALQTCVGAARSVITSMSDYLGLSTDQQSHLRQSDFAPLLWPSFTWAVWMSAFILIYAASEREVPLRVAIRLTDKSLKLLQHLSTRGSVWPSACEVAIRELRVKLDEGSKSSNRAAEKPSLRAAKTQQRTSQHLQETCPHSTTQNLPHEHDSPVSITGGENHPLRSYAHPGRASQQTSPTTDSSPSQRTLGRYNSGHWLNGQATPNSASIHPVGRPTSYPQQLIPFSMNSPTSPRQQMSWLGNTALPQSDAVDIFQGFEIPFWMGDDQYASLINS